MNTRFAEPCRRAPLEFEGTEWDVFTASGLDGRAQKDICLTCEQDIYIGVFFDGTNNNKYRDTPNNSQSNVARLYEAYIGTPAKQSEPNLADKINADRSKTPRKPFIDSEFLPASVPKVEQTYYRKIYVPGVGTPMPDVRDSGTETQKTLGLAMAAMSQIRLEFVATVATVVGADVDSGSHS